MASFLPPETTPGISEKDSLVMGGGEDDDDVSSLAARVARDKSSREISERGVRLGVVVSVSS